MVFAQTYSQTFTPDSAPRTWRLGQTGTNKCGNLSNQKSTCQNAYGASIPSWLSAHNAHDTCSWIVCTAVNSVEDFCLFAPHQPGSMSDIGNMERSVVAWCLKPGYGTRIIPPGAITGAHFVQTPDYVQVTGTGDLTKLNVPKGDTGGELDPHGEDGLGERCALSVPAYTHMRPAVWQAIPSADSSSRARSAT